MHFFTEEKVAKLLGEIKGTIYRESHPIPQFKYVEADPPGAQQPDFDDSAWGDFRLMDYWGGYDKIAWFRAHVPIPAHLRDKKLSLNFLVGPRDGGDSTAETMLYVNGFPLQAIDVWHEEAWLPPEYSTQDRIFIALRSWSGVLGVPDRRRFKVAQLNWVDEGAEGYYFLALNLLKAVRVLDENDWRRVKMLDVLNESTHRINFTKPRSDQYYTTITAARDFLQNALAELHEVEDRQHKPKVIGVGHSHIDLAWLWRWSHSREKAGRTFATVLHLMRQYPEYRFMHSSPALYKALAEDYPDIFERVKAKIDSGEWEITGAMWVEADTNVPSGESLIRQILYGKRYVREVFGKEMRVLWLPDVFGYSAALPQILVKSGIDTFLTTKISWSQINRFPYDTFLWRGIDGTEILTHFITAPEEGSLHYTYNGTFEPAELKGMWDAYRGKQINDELLLAFGWGDGGGGPTREMLESARVLKNLPGFPSVEMGTVEPYFDRLRQRMAERDLPVWDGELYLEFHRGTYTSQAANKRANRQCEILYHDAEILSSMADILLGENQYPDLREGWELILFNQFHDVLPGSSIRQVYEDSAVDYARAAEIGQAALDSAIQRIAANIRTETDSIVVFNTRPCFRSEPIQVPFREGVTPESWKLKYVQDARSQAPTQVIQDGDEQFLLLNVHVNSFGYSVLEPLDGSSENVQPLPPNTLQVTSHLLENRDLRVELNNQGQITSIYDKTTRREVLAPGARGNVLQAFEDKPMAFDAWDIDLYYQEKMQEVTDLVEAVVEETGPVRGTLRVTWRFYDSTITQRISLYTGSPRVDFRTEIDWHEQQVLLKAAFPVNIRATRATYDIQFGQIERPTHWNTSWDYARFEVPMQKWMELSEAGYAVAILNDCKYGGDIKDNVMRLTLLKSAIRPDALADKGRHVFTYSLFARDALQSRPVWIRQQANQLNYPLRAVYLPANPQGILPDVCRFVETGVEVASLKRAEDGDGWIIRVHDDDGLRGDKRLSFQRPLRRAVECNLVEEGESSVEVVAGNTLEFHLKPFEIKTFRVWFEGEGSGTGSQG
ncbi:MAG: alpha-mannosidase [bacterium]|nr:alpha-mannosidase [bacterium]